MRRSLVLRRETLTELTDGDLLHVAGGMLTVTCSTAAPCFTHRLVNCDLVTRTTTVVGPTILCPIEIATVNSC